MDRKPGRTYNNSGMDLSFAELPRKRKMIVFLADFIPVYIYQKGPLL